MDEIVRRVPDVSPRFVLVVTDDRTTTSPDTDDVEIAFEVDGRVVVASSFDLDRVIELRDMLTEVVQRPLPPPAR